MERKKLEELEQALLALKKENNQENIARLMKQMEQNEFFVPAVLPPDTDPHLIKQIVERKGKTVPLPQGVSPRPAILTDKEGARFLALFTSEEQMSKGKQEYPLTMKVPFQSCVELLAGQEQMSGFVLNVFDHNIAMHVDVSKKKQEPEKVRLTEPQLHAMLRQRLEAAVLPAALFEKKGALLREIREREGETLMELYGEIYPEQVECPYQADDFEVMALNIRENLTVVRITMPADKLEPGTCPMVLVSWNPLQETIRYFGIVKGKNGEKAHIMEALEDGSKKDMGQAPAEGSELQFIIDVNEK